jgi:ribosomal protein S18 acetylase RimI-like enzyme
MRPISRSHLNPTRFPNNPMGQSKMKSAGHCAQSEPMTQSTQPVPFRIRLATPDDLPRLVELINSAYSIETFLEGTRTNLERLAESMKTGKIFVMEDGEGNLLASAYTELRGARGYLGMLAAHPAHQGRGLAHRIFLAAQDHFRAHGCTAIDISVLSLRPELLPIYRRFGFVETGTEPFHFPRTFKEQVECHCILMSKAL